MAWWLRRRTSMPEVMGSIPAQVRLQSNTLRQSMSPWLLLDCTEDLYVYKMCSTWKFVEGSMEFSHWGVMWSLESRVNGCHDQYKTINQYLYIKQGPCGPCKTLSDALYNMNCWDLPTKDLGHLWLAYIRKCQKAGTLATECSIWVLPRKIRLPE